MMSFAGKGTGWEFCFESGSQDDFQSISIKIEVKEIRKLWETARQILALYGMSRSEVDECIGPMGDMSVEDCLRTLFAPLEIPGCAVHDVEVVAIPRPVEAVGAKDIGALLAAAATSAQISADQLWPSAKAP